MLHNAPGMSAEYMEAAGLLNDATMMSLCELLQNDDHDTSMEKMTEIHQACEKAAKVIEQQAPAPIMPNSIAAPGLRLAARASASKSNTIPRGRSMMVVPSNRNKRMAVERQKSDSTTGSVASNAEPPPGYAKQFLAKLNADDSKPPPKRVRPPKIRNNSSSSTSTAAAASGSAPTRTQPSRSSRK